jgi:hypothetical protein
MKGRLIPALPRVVGGLVVNPNENINPPWKEPAGSIPWVLASAVGLGPGLRYTYWKNIQPRLGSAWSPANSHDTLVLAYGFIMTSLKEDRFQNCWRFKRLYD